jgi:alkylated DNA nucleotide flippase Atl1
MDTDLLTKLLKKVPKGKWVAYGDLARAAGTSPRALNQAFLRYGLPNAHRVLMTNGAVASTALGDPVEVRRRLEAEGLEFENGKATPKRRVQLD